METPITNCMQKIFASLDAAKCRRREGLFPAEGTKCVVDLLPRFTCEWLFALPEWIEAHAPVLAEYAPVRCVPSTPQMIRSITRLPSAPEVTAFFALPAPKAVPDVSAGELVLALDCIQDPGNMGTIVRCCSWMGVKKIVASTDTVDCFNPKAVQASMGALARVMVFYTDLAAWLGTLDMPVYGTFLDGLNIYKEPLPKEACLVMGNEGRGISPEVERVVTNRLFIPPYPLGSHPQDSLNVGMATAIALSQFRSKL